ncbi:Serine/threonine-protein phosphatase 2A activator 1 [Aspergillus flavus]|uniref:Serine/threonine-protein phosphatase 2A activator n=1 Tax=Aspergillus flavus TaxID=5059 RepID=A0AB74CAR7_ASPFL|nr:serine/threonine-protein phosphatase 2A activator 1 [Aspergillus flavus]RAQ69621.1 serine/threonine-protein phosphatase 2A activator 1 [Aspergillus flavus]RMZ43749.1 serine/threonine-protein phosphatase 2A activator 1 [Aspergillus flavus]UDD55166.1 Serine/threonine-protein phosphatase 2A activator 1 [Aspergillus flavus]
MAAEGISVRVLPTIDPSAGHTFLQPSKRINEPDDVSEFLCSKAYVDIMTFLLQLNRSVFPAKLTDGSIQTWPLNSEAVVFSASVRQLQQLLSKLEVELENTPLQDGEWRFANGGYRDWYDKVAEKASTFLEECLSAEILHARSSESDAPTAETELKEYFLGSWGSRERMDYGTGHELNFLAFLAGIWKLNGFPKNEFGVEERAIVLGVIEPYLELVRAVIKKFKLEPAGSHGVWGLDDHAFIPYIFGSAQLGPAVSDSDPVPETGSLPDAVDPDGVTKVNIVNKERRVNMYFSAVGFIYDVKQGPFYEHSQMLYDISGVRAGWAKINKGMIKMYNAEVLSKFPVVQHFRFGSLFSWDRDPSAIPPPSRIHTSSGPETPSRQVPSTARHDLGPGTKAPWATASQSIPPPSAGTAAPWATARAGRGPPTTSRIPPALPDTSRLPPGPMAPTRAPWAGSQPAGPAPTGDPNDNTTKAPWAK